MRAGLSGSPTLPLCPPVSPPAGLVRPHLGNLCQDDGSELFAMAQGFHVTQEFLPVLDFLHHCKGGHGQGVLLSCSLCVLWFSSPPPRAPAHPDVLGETHTL